MSRIEVGVQAQRCPIEAVVPHLTRMGAPLVAQVVVPTEVEVVVQRSQIVAEVVVQLDPIGVVALLLIKVQETAREVGATGVEAAVQQGQIVAEVVVQELDQIKVEVALIGAEVLAQLVLTEVVALRDHTKVEVEVLLLLVEVVVQLARIEVVALQVKYSF